MVSRYYYYPLEFRIVTINSVNWSPCQVSTENKATWQRFVIWILFDNFASNKRLVKVIVKYSTEFIITHFIASVIAIPNTPAFKASYYVRNIKVHLFYEHPLVVPQSSQVFFNFTPPPFVFASARCGVVSARRSGQLSVSAAIHRLSSAVGREPPQVFGRMLRVKVSAIVALTAPIVLTGQFDGW